MTSVLEKESDKGVWWGQFDWRDWRKGAQGDKKGKGMWRVTKVFVPLEGSPDDQAALEAAEEVASRREAELILVAIIPSFRTVPSHDVVLLIDLAVAAGQAKDYLDELADAVSQRDSRLDVRTLVRVSPLSAADMGAELMHLAGQEGCDLVVMTPKSEVARAIRYLPRHDLAILLVPAGPDSSSGRRARAWWSRFVPRPRLVPRPQLAWGSLFFFAGPEGRGGLWGLPGPGQEE